MIAGCASTTGLWKSSPSPPGTIRNDWASPGRSHQLRRFLGTGLIGIARPHSDERHKTNYGVRPGHLGSDTVGKRIYIPQFIQWHVVVLGKRRLTVQPEWSRKEWGSRNRGPCSEWAGGLKIRCTSGDATAAVEFATGTIVGKELDVIGPRCDRADDDLERAVPVEISGDNSDFYFRKGRGHSLFSSGCASAAAAIGRKLAEVRREGAAEEVKSDLIQFAWSGTHQGEGHRQGMGGRGNDPLDAALGEVQGFAEVVPTVGPLLRCYRCGRGANRQQKRERQ